MGRLCYTFRMIAQKIRDDLTASMRARDSVRTDTLRGLIAGFTNELVSKGKKPQDEVDDGTASAVIKRSVKQRKDSIEQFRKGGREDLAAKEESELAILETYMPQQASHEEIEKVVRAVKERMSITDKAKMGILIGAVMRELKGQADGAEVKDVVEGLL